MKKLSTSNVEDVDRLKLAVTDAIPSRNPDIIEWANSNVVLPSSARSKHFNISVTPWLREPLQRAVDLQTRIISFRKPVQSGGSTFGEALMLYWICYWRGFLQYNWSTDKRAKDRWNSRLEAIIDASPALVEYLKFAKRTCCEIDFGSVFLRVQGAFVEDNLDSDSIPLQLNEEVHSWEPGHLKKARARSTAVWNFKSVDISNAGDVGDQFDQAHREGTMQEWEVACPGCSNKNHKANTVYHILRTKWEDDHPELGGLVYDADGCRLGGFKYNYNKLRPTIRLQMPCGFQVHNEDMQARRGLSLSGRYTAPRNTGAEVSHRSYTYESVSVDYIDLMTLVKEKHEALRARSLGDPEPFRRYMRERECIPYDPNDVPIVNAITLTKNIKKSRDGLPQPRFRSFSLDRQQGVKAAGERPYWWLVIRDFKIFYGAVKARLVYEGRVTADEDVVKILDEHGCERYQGCADSGDDTDHVYAFCMKYGINAIKGGGEPWYVHEGGARRIYGEEHPLHSMMNVAPKYQYVDAGKDGMVPDDREPMFWIYSKSAIREYLNWLKGAIEYETPSDVSDAYKLHHDAEERVKRLSRQGQEIWEWIQRKSRNDLFVCECYCAMLFNMSGAMGEANLGETSTVNESK